MVQQHADAERTERLAEVVGLAEGRLDGEELSQFLRFVDVFYARVQPEDLAVFSDENLYGAALAIWKLGATRRPGEPRIRAYNPRVDEHGWTSSHTIIEVINDDMPFIVDSVLGCLDRMGLQVHLFIHPIVRVRRDEDGRRTDMPEHSEGDGTLAESALHIEISEHSDLEVLGQIEQRLEAVIDDVRAAVDDWHLILGQLDEAIADLEKPLPVEQEEVDEVRAFLEWMRDNHFTFLGMREYVYEQGKGKAKAKAALRIVEGSGRGILRRPERQVLTGTVGADGLTPMVEEFFNRPELMLITKTSVRGTVHRAVHMDYIGVKRFDAKGQLVGERRFVGLFTSSAYSRTPRDIPLLRRRIGQVLAMAGMAPFSHDGKALTHILDTYPRDELFQIDLQTLHDISIGILGLQERPQIRMFARRDTFERYFSCIVFVPRQRMSTGLRRRFTDILVEAFNGRLSNFSTQISDSPLARLLFIIGTDPGAAPAEVDYRQIERRLVAAARTWSDDLYDALVEHLGEERGNLLVRKYADAFSAAYAESFNAERALGDIDHLESLLDGNEVGLNFYRVIEDPEHMVRFKFYCPDQAVPLSDCLPMLENMGLKVIGETPFQIRLESGQMIWIHDFSMEEPGGAALDLSSLKPKLESAFYRVWRGELENDGFNRLVLVASLAWREVAVIRAFCKYLRQTGSAFSQAYMETALANNPDIVRLLVALFHCRFDPDHGGDREARGAALVTEIETALEAVQSLDEDRILRRYLNLLTSSLRTNFFQLGDDGEAKPYISFKFDSQTVAELPLPRPFREIFVYSPRVEAVHLRGGKVARGGLRWSDRREDFRTEVLGLMKAQMVKNAVIVPVGSKGGFFPKQLPAGGDREAVQAEVVASYQTFIRGMLDITDNLKAGEVVAPPRVVRYDEDDPYLVVAADKGTATFSDIANDISLDYGFWLGDAFASGGRTGYDHKAMAITARGAWESVKRHFRELGHDTQAEDFTVVGIGDMSGDVFGNGMLLSEHIRLLAAFDHRHVFIDPEPDAEKSYAERKRLFELPRSSWADYDEKLISKGGGVFDRQAKSVTLTPEIKALTGLGDAAVTPAELIHALLKAEVDLLWFGGIGTYVKASDESHDEAGDRANDGLRVDGAELRCKVVGEGGNLGCTQLGRIEFAHAGGRINSDAIDNSGGVDSSDHEVNIKVLLGAVVDDGEMTEKQRNRLLAQMTDEVGELVLRNNYLQTQALSMLESRSASLLEQQVRYMRALERAGQLDPAIEFLPDEEILEARRNDSRGLARPELAVLLAYAKMVLYEDFLESDLTDSEYLVNDVIAYFPGPLRKKHKSAVLSHQLRKEILATLMANSVVNRTGITFVHDVMEETGESAEAVARAYAASRDAFGLAEVWDRIEALDNRVPAALQSEMLVAVADLVRHGTLWLLRNRPQPIRIAEQIAAFQPGIQALATALDGIAGESERRHVKDRAAAYVTRGADEELATRVAGLELMVAALDIVEAARGTNRPVEEVGRIYFLLGAELGLDWLRHQAEGLEPADYWERTAIASIVDDLYGQQRTLTAKVLTGADGQDGPLAVKSWSEANAASVARSRDLVEDFRQSGGLDIAKLALANRLVRRMIAG
ncbi:MAG: NAD-glutamate dehydrogenase [Alphaproteobacteria bacterium]|nr:NAD-glutamate dehydrogenase [Alphaproteobacteria bacterium]